MSQIIDNERNKILATHVIHADGKCNEDVQPKFIMIEGSSNDLITTINKMAAKGYEVVTMAYKGNNVPAVIMRLA